MLHTEHDVAPAELANFPFGQKLHLAWPSLAAYRPTPQSSHSPRRVSWVLALANFPAGQFSHVFELGSKYLPGSWHSNVSGVVRPQLDREFLRFRGVRPELHCAEAAFGTLLNTTWR